MFPSEDFVQEIKERYPVVIRIQLDFMDDTQAISPCIKGTVRLVDDAAQIHVNWDNGRSLAVIPGEDSFHKIIERNRNDGAR